jgi:hypothetical protein
MHLIRVYTESRWIQTRPKLRFRVNNIPLPAKEHRKEKIADVERMIFSLTFEREFDSTNTLDIELYDQQDLLIPEQSQCCVDIKDISVDDIFADYLIYNTEFRHSMSDQWVREQADRGYQTAPMHSPGTVMQLNGTCTWRFDSPVWLGKIKDLWNE